MAVTEVKQEAEAKVTEVTKEAEATIVATQASVASQVNTELANIGIEANAIKISTETLPTRTEVIEKLSELQKLHGTGSKEATSYYSKHRAIVWSK